MATTAQTTAQTSPPPVCLVLRIQAVLVVPTDLVSAREPLPEDCMDCGQTAVAFDGHGVGWCTAHAPLELLCP